MFRCLSGVSGRSRDLKLPLFSGYWSFVLQKSCKETMLCCQRGEKGDVLIQGKLRRRLVREVVGERCVARQRTGRLLRQWRSHRLKSQMKLRLNCAVPSCGNRSWPRGDVVAAERRGKARGSCSSFPNCSAQRDRRHARSWKKLFHKLHVWHSSHRGFKCDLKAFSRNIFIKTIMNVQETRKDKFAINKPTNLEHWDVNTVKRWTWTDLDDGFGFPSLWIFLQYFFVCLQSHFW